MLFTDVVGSTEHRTALGDDRADEVRRSHDATVGAAIASHGGRVLKHTGDGVMAVFPGTGAAVRAAIDIQRGVVRLAPHLEVDLQVRVGVSAGDVEWDGEDCFGIPVVEAARLCGVASPGQILAADVVRVLAGTRGGLEFRSVGELDLAGLEGQRSAHEVPWSEPPADRVPLPAAMQVERVAGLVGRDSELERLERAWADAAKAPVRGVFVSGEPGIGKSRLVTELAKRVWEQGAPVVLGRCEDGVRSPLRPVIEIVTHLVRHAPADALRQLPESHRRALARLVPELDPDAIAERADPLVEVPLRAAALRSLFTIVAPAEPLLIVFDDLHWADADTLAVLRHLLADESDAAMLLVGTYRDTDLDRTHPLGAMLADLRRAGNADRIVLRGLDREGARELIEQWAGHDVPGPFVEAILQETEGNPFFVEEVLRHLAETGAIRPDDDGRWTSDRPLSELGIPEGVRETVGRRLARFDDRTSRLLATAAVAGREFDLDIAAAVAEMSFDDAITALEPVVGAGLVEETATVGRFAFAHALVRATLVDELVTVRRIRTHQRLAETIEALRPHQADDNLEALAYHYSEAAAGGTWSKAVDYRSAAADRAYRLVSFDTSIEHLDRALELLRMSPLEEPSLETDLMCRLGWLLSAGFDRDRAITVSTQALDMAMSTRDPHLIAQAARSMGNLLDFNFPDQRLVERLDDAAQSISPEHEVAHANLIALRAHVESATADGRPSYERSLETAETATVLADRLGDAWPDRGHAYLALSQALMTRSSPGRALDALDQFELTITESDARTRAAAQSRRAGLLGQLARRDDFDRAVRALEENPASRASPLGRAALEAIHGAIALLEGRLLDATGHIAASREIAGDHLPNHRLGAAAQGVLLLHEQGELQPDRFARLARSTPFPWMRALEALVWAEAGEPDRASIGLDEFAQQDDLGIPFDLSQAQTLRVLAESAAHVGDRELAGRLLPYLQPYSGQLLVSYMFTTCEGAADRALGQLLFTMGHHDEAVRSYEAALALEEGFRAGALVARTQAWLSRALTARDAPGDLERRDELVGAVRHTASELGLHGVGALVR